jgi:RNA polymerase sigma-70 factor, ECF subfamily
LKALKQEADEQLLVEAAKQDPARFAELYEHNFYQVYAYIARRVGSRDEAEDLTSEVFHHALANLMRFEWRGTPFAAWLIRIAANAIADRWRLQAREIGNPVAAEPKDLSMEGFEQRAALFQLVESLPPAQRQVVFLRFVEQKSVKEIAHELQRSEGAVKQLQFRALEKLRASMEGANG